MDPGLVGLSLSYALTVTQSLSYLVTMVSEVETNMVGVERIKEYQEITEEAPLNMPQQDPPPEWPQYGVVKFDNYQTRYRPGLDLVLKGKIWPSHIISMILHLYVLDVSRHV